MSSINEEAKESLLPGALMQADALLADEDLKEVEVRGFGTTLAGRVHADMAGRAQQLLLAGESVIVDAARLRGSMKS